MCKAFNVHKFECDKSRACTRSTILGLLIREHIYFSNRKSIIWYVCVWGGGGGGGGGGRGCSASFNDYTSKYSSSLNHACYPSLVYFKSTLFEVVQRGLTRVVIRNSRTNNKRRVNTFVYEELLIIDNFSEIYFLKTKKGKVK